MCIRDRRYAVGPDAPWEQSFADGRAGLAWVRAHAAELDIHPAKVAVVGFSAGGHLATSLGTLSDNRPDALVLGYPVTLAEFGPVMGKEVPDTPAAVTQDTPPTLLFSCLLYTSPSPRDRTRSRMPSSA